MKAGLLALVMFAAAGCSGPSQAPKLLRVCSDPNNLPFSSADRAGLENRIAALLADDQQVEIEYTWWSQRRGFVRHALDAQRCDVILAVPTDMPGVGTTQPYYRSRYAFVTKVARGLQLDSLDDPLLRGLRIGVQVIGDDGANSPPAHALSRRGIVDNLVGFSVIGDANGEPPLARIVSAVATGEVDAAAVWGPAAGYFVAKQQEPLAITPIPDGEGDLPLSFGISMAVRKDDTDRLRALERFIARRRADIDRVLDEYHVPRSVPGDRP
jgi:mxaJ protein